MAVARCNVSSRDLFIFILFVAFLSVLFNLQISYDGSRFVDQRVQIDEIIAVQEVRERTDRYDAKILGRSLNQHEAESQKTRTTEKLEIRSKLIEIESKLLKATPRVVALRGDIAAEDKLMKRLQELDIDVVKKHDALSWVDTGTVVQGNWTVLFCFSVNDCQQVHTEISQKLDRIPELVALIKKPKVLCSASRMSERSTDKESTSLCGPFSCDIPLNDSTFVVTEDTTYFNTYTPELCKSKRNLLGGYVWYLPDRPITFPGGPVLRIHCVLVSVSPLRFYVHPDMQAGSLYALRQTALFRKVNIEDLLQYISEVYGLGTSSHWWREIQTRLLLYFLYLEIEIRKFKLKESQRCKRCFQSLQVDMVCSSVENCQIFTVTTGQHTLNLSLIGSMKTLVTSRLHVSEELEQVLAQVDYSQVTELCTNKSIQADCLTENYLMYLLDWRREMRSSSDLIPIYPSKFGCKELSRHDEKNTDFSETIEFNDFTRSVGNAIRWTDKTSAELQYLADGEDVDYTDSKLTKQGRNTQETTRPCSNDPNVFGKIDEIVIYPQVKVEEISPNTYNASVGYDTILVRLEAVSKSCKCQVKLENKYNEPGARNVTLGLGDNKIMLYVVDTTSQDLKIVSTVVINIYRQRRGLGLEDFDEQRIKFCGLKQDCSLRFDNTARCSVFNLQTSPKDADGRVYSRKRCTTGDHEGQWIVPCRSCSTENDCFWEKAAWQAHECRYEQFSPASLQQCLRGKKLLFIGDSTNRGVSNYIIEQINGSLYDWDKTHSTRVYTNINNNRTHFTFAYYPHFWLPADHRPRFSKVIYQLIKSSLPLQNNSKTVLVVGGVHWIAKQHIDLIVEALQRKGLSGITKVVKGLGAGFHQQVENVKFVPKSEHVQLQQRESDILNYAKTKGFHTVATFNMTISRYKDFLEGNCACHFHKVSKHGSASRGYHYKVEGEMNAAYSQILLNQICPDV